MQHVDARVVGLSGLRCASWLVLVMVVCGWFLSLWPWQFDFCVLGATSRGLAFLPSLHGLLTILGLFGSLFCFYVVIYVCCTLFGNFSLDIVKFRKVGLNWLLFTVAILS